MNTEYSQFDYKLQKIDAPVLLGVNVLGPLNIKAGPAFQYILKNELENTSTVGEQRSVILQRTASVGDIQDSL